MLWALNLVDQIFYIISAVLIAFLAVEVVDIVLGFILMLPHCLHRGETLIAVFERAFDLVGYRSHD